MARVDKEGDLRRDMAEMKGEMLQTVRQSGRRPRFALGCGIVALVVLVLSLFAAAWAFAATGLANVPVLTSVAYHRPEPAHPVAATVTLDLFVSDFLNRVLTARLQQGGGTLNDRSISIDLPEGSFTASLRAALKSNAQTAIDPDRSQVAVDEQGLELYLPLADNPRGSAVTLRLRMETGQDGLTVRVSDLHVGSLPFPDFVTQAVLAPAVQSSFAGFAKELARYATITSVSYAPGAVTLKGDLTVEVLKLK